MIIDPYWTDLLTYVGISIIVALGVQVTMASGQLHSAGAAFMGLSGYAAAFLTVAIGVPLPIASAIGVLVSAVVALVLGSAIVRLNTWFFALATLGLGQVFVIVFDNADPVGGAAGYSSLPIATNLPEVIVILVLLLGVLAWYQNSELAQACRAVAEDPLAAAATGIPVLKTRLIAFTLGSTICGIGGTLYVFYAGYIRPSSMDFLHSLNYLVYVALGGQGTWLGPILGASILVIGPEILRFSDTYRFMLYGLLLMVITILRPRGLLVRKPVATSLRDAMIDDLVRSPLSRIVYWFGWDRAATSERAGVHGDAG